jgi:hypothetical protein
MKELKVTISKGQTDNGWFLVVEVDGEPKQTFGPCSTEAEVDAMGEDLKNMLASAYACEIESFRKGSVH